MHGNLHVGTTPRLARKPRVLKAIQNTCNDYRNQESTGSTHTDNAYSILGHLGRSLIRIVFFRHMTYAGE